MKKIFLTATLALLLVGCGKDRAATINTDPAAVGTPDLTYLLASTLGKMRGNEYLIQFYTTNRYVTPWAQMTVGYSDYETPALNTSSLFDLIDNGNPTLGTYYDISNYSNHIKYVISGIKDEDLKLSYTYLAEIAQIGRIQTAIYATDYNGAIPYEQAGKGLYTDPPLIRPVFDSQEKVFNQLDAELKNAVSIMSSPVVNSSGQEIKQIAISATQEPVYKGDEKKWITYANSLRLKVAARLIHANKQKAIEIAQEVATDGRYMKTNSDDYRTAPGKYEYGYGGIWAGTAAKGFTDFLKANRDPRLRFFFFKNAFNSLVIQGFLDNDKPLPPYIASQVVLSDDGKDFIRYKSAADGDGEQYMGEPWVRYQGIPSALRQELTDEEVNMYVNQDATKIKIGDVNRYFNPVSGLNMFLFNPGRNYDYPSMKPAMDYYKFNNDYQYSMVLLGSAETNLNMALFALLGVNVPGETANTLFQKGIECSVLAYNQTAKNHNYPYYETEYDQTTYIGVDGKPKPVAQPIKLKDNELPDLLQKDAYTLKGDQVVDIEKVYIQLMINAYSYPADLYPIIKFGGVPRYDSSVWPRDQWVKGRADDQAINIPRRFLIAEPSEASINYANQKQAITDQGFVDLSSPSPSMTTERYWYDKNAPAWGSNPGL